MCVAALKNDSSTLNTSTTVEDFKEHLKTMGMNLRALRLSQKKDIRATAAAMKIKGKILEQIENGQYDMRLDLLFHLCHHYNVSVADVLTKGKFDNAQGEV